MKPRRLFVCFAAASATVFLPVCPIAYADLNAPLPDGAVLLFEDDGTGINPTTSMSNDWDFPSGWSAGVTASQVAGFSNYAGTDAAAEMIAALGEDNNFIIYDTFSSDTSSATVGPFSGTIPTSGRTVGPMFYVQEAVTDVAGLIRATFLFDAFRLYAEDRTIPQPPPPGGPDVEIKLWTTMHVIREVDMRTGALMDHSDALGEIRAAGIDSMPIVGSVNVQFLQLPEVDVTLNIPADQLGQLPPEWISTLRMRNIPEPATISLLGFSIAAAFACVRRGRWRR